MNNCFKFFLLTVIVSLPRFTACVLSDDRDDAMQLSLMQRFAKEQFERGLQEQKKKYVSALFNFSEFAASVSPVDHEAKDRTLLFRCAQENYELEAKEQLQKERAAAQIAINAVKQKVTPISDTEKEKIYASPAAWGNLG